MIYKETPLKDVVLLVPKVFGDERGFFLETFRQNEFEENCGKYSFVQENHSKSAKGILRGLHYQVEQTQGKLVRVVQGEVYDVTVDMRQSSPTFGQSFGILLSAENKYQLWVPPGFAHGFYVTSEDAEFVYKCTDYYAPEYERSLLWNDPALKIDWPLVNDQTPQLSAKDEIGGLFKDMDYLS
ncbi:MAG: dTDP-4-dehydrorhamnose 3,5-epimerase [Lentisphaeraceae bacterium]|nr:dTDP-4-dehydrorhamnose 3,5-epimerase [Lentisphaeraceae bacterium]